MSSLLPLGPISSILVNKYGSRPVMIAGGCLSSVGLISASFCNSVQALYFYIGVIGGWYSPFHDAGSAALCRHLLFK